MSIQLIQQYHAKVEKIIRYSGSRNESALSKAFQDLLEAYAKSKNLLLVPGVEVRTRSGRRVVPDGTLKDALRQDWGYWESKDEKDDLDAEIAAKFAKGYPSNNILFEDTRTAVLYQSGDEVLRADFADAKALDALLTRFVSCEPREVTEFHHAIEQFNVDVPALVAELRAIIEEQYNANVDFRKALSSFLELCKKAINPRVEMADMREMIIQHILTEDIFMTVFDDPQFHQDNAVARKLQEVLDTFYHGATHRNIHNRIAPYYETINARAAQIYNHWEKQKFLKALYENFYRVYNPKAADRLGVIYTPDEIVRFMIHAADHLVFKHFGRTLGDANVEILDPAVGTGTFITELIEYLPETQLKYKYQNEIHCNEVAILPYYIANLNIEYTYKQKTGEYLPFDNICFVDTLDNLGFVKSGQHQKDFFAIVDENIERIQRQNERKISVIIGNPPYNDNQRNENENNKNREYPEIDRRIKDTYIKHSTAQKTHLYDMYTRFIRWASSRLDRNGVIAFVSNNSFLDARTYDGFRKVVADEFNHIYVIDLKGNARTSGERRRREGGNVFSDQIRVGVAVYFLVRKQGKKGCRVHYNAVPDYAHAVEKKAYLRDNTFTKLKFEPIHPDKNHNWLNQSANDWGELLPIVPEDNNSPAIFKFISPGVKTNRDDWVYDYDKRALQSKVKFFIQRLNEQVKKTKQSRNADSDNLDYSIKWSSSLKELLTRGKPVAFDDSFFVQAMYRPFVRVFYYADKNLSDRLTSNHFEMFGNGLLHENVVLCLDRSNRPFNVLVAKLPADFHFNGDSHCFPLYRYTADGERVDNITDWALEQFREHYGPSPLTPLPVGEGDLGGEVKPVARIKPPLPPALLARVRELRQNATDAEHVLWQLLRNRQLMGYKFRRQHPLAGYILDFYCHEARLAVELDGGQHAEPEQDAYDAERTRILEAEGLRVLRFWNNDVLRNTEAVLEVIMGALSPHPPAPSPGRRRRVEGKPSAITKEDIFHYVYAVLHHPAYRAKYEINLKREFPRIPFYEDFWQWAKWGKQLMDLHLNYEKVKPYPLKREDKDPETVRKAIGPRLMAHKDAGVIEVDTLTTLKDVPAEAWEYRLGTYSALEWILERYKERKPKDPTIREKFNTYKFADYKEQVIDLLQRVCTVSVETMKIIRQMPD